MSVDLEIKISKAILIDHLLDASERVIKELLPSTYSSPLKAERMVKGNRQPATSNAFSTGSGMLLIGYEGLKDFATIGVVDLPDLPPFSDGIVTGFHETVSSKESGIGYALAACVASLLGKEKKRQL